MSQLLWNKVINAEVVYSSNKAFIIQSKPCHYQHKATLKMLILFELNMLFYILVIILFCIKAL